MTTLYHAKNIETFQQLQDAIARLGRLAFINENERQELLEYGNLDGAIICTEDALLDLNGALVPNATLETMQGFHYPYNPVQVWRIGAKGEKPTWVTAFPKRKSTMTKKGYIEGCATYKVTLEIEVLINGCFIRQHNRHLIEVKWEA